MRFWKLTAFLVFCATLYNAPAFAAEPQGFAKYTEGNSDLYLAAIFSPNGPDGSVDFNSVKPRRIEIKVLADKFSHRRFKRHFIHRTAINNSQKNLKRSATDLEYFLNWFNQPLSRGDHIVIEQKGRILTLSINSGQVGTLTSSTVFEIMQNAWVGDTPPSLQFKSQLLGEQDSTGARKLFYQLETESSRKSLAHLMREEATLQQANHSANKTSNSDLTKKPAKVVAPKVPAPRIVKPAARKVVKKPIIKKPVVKKTAVKKPVPVKSAPKVIRLTAEELAAKEQILRDNYADLLRQHALKNIKYSSNSRPPRYEDTLKATLVIDRSGKLISFKFIDQSIFSAVNRDIKKSIRRAEPYPLIPTNISGNTFTFDLTIVVRSQR